MFLFLTCSSLFLLRTTFAEYDICDSDNTIDAAFFNRFNESNLFIVTAHLVTEVNLVAGKIVSQNNLSKYWARVKPSVSFAMSEMNGTQMRVIFGKPRHYYDYLCSRGMSCRLTSEGLLIDKNRPSLIKQDFNLNPGAAFIYQKGMIPSGKHKYWFHMFQKQGDQLDCIRDSQLCEANDDKKWTFTNYADIRQKKGEEPILAISAKHNSQTNDTDFAVFVEGKTIYSNNRKVEVIRTQQDVFDCATFPWIFYVIAVGFFLLLVSLGVNIGYNLCYGGVGAHAGHYDGMSSVTKTTGVPTVTKKGFKFSKGR